MGKWRLDGKLALITGGTRGIGLAIAEEMLDLGASVFIVARDQAAVRARLEPWRGRGLSANGIAADVSTPEGRQAIFTELGKLSDRLDILVNNVGTNIRKRMVDYAPGEYRHVIATNMDSAFEMSRLSYGLLRAADGAAVVNVLSVAALTHMRT